MRAKHVLLALAAAVLCGFVFGCRPQTRPAPKPRYDLLEVRMYEWALSTGGMFVDMRTGEIEGFTRGVPISEAERQQLAKDSGEASDIYHIQAKLSDQELADLRAFVESFGLRGFEPVDTDVNERMPHVDECPPTLVLIYSDKRRSFSLPLRDTVKQDLEPERLRCYKSMKDLCDRLISLRNSYAKLPYLTMVPVQGPEYKRFEKERDGR